MKYWVKRCTSIRGGIDAHLRLFLTTSLREAKKNVEYKKIHIYQKRKNRSESYAETYWKIKTILSFQVNEKFLHFYKKNCHLSRDVIYWCENLNLFEFSHLLLGRLITLALLGFK